ncbi:MAG: hypothetical protein H7256_00365 [Bdellovibrio sp.]|nr:hypothetical protein [Bdellovibrio sp.]
MKKNYKAKTILSIFVIVALVSIWFFNSNIFQPTPAKQTLGLMQLSSSAVKEPSAKSNDAKDKITAKNSNSNASYLSAAEMTSLSDMTQTLYQYTQADARLQDLLRFLESTGQKPTVVNNSNADTGEMAIVRTGSPLPGTRYFHAQYFSDENKKSFVQHMSFELKSGGESMASAVAAVESNFKNLPAPATKTPDFMQWNLPNGQIVWIKKLAANDLKDNPFNAYTSDDVGTVRVAVELEIHGDE